MGKFLLFSAFCLSLCLASRQCPDSYLNSDSNECDPPNCGGFAGTECSNDLQCWYPVGFDAGYCVDQTEFNSLFAESNPDLDQDAEEDCVLCEKMMPICDCNEDEDCIQIPQTCNECAKAICKPKQ